MKNSWFDLALGIAVGVALTGALVAGYNFARGWQNVGVWQRAIDERNADEIEELMLNTIDTADRSIADDQPSTLAGRLADSVFPAQYEHYLTYARHLLENGEIETFNQLSLDTSFAILDLSGADLSGLDLSDVRFDGSILEGTNFSNCILDGASFSMARLVSADFSNARLDRTVFLRAELSNARFNGVSGATTDFRQTVLTNASITSVTELQGARFDGAVMAQSNLQGSHFPGAVFDGADMTLVSAVDCDFSTAQSLSLVTMTGANLSGARFDPGVCWKLWLANAQGLDRGLSSRLRDRDSIIEPKRLLDLVDQRIVDGFRAQLNANDAIEVKDRETLLIDLLRQFWMQ